MQGYYLHAFNSHGFNSGIAFETASAADVNPAALNNNRQFSTAVSYQFRTKITDAYFGGDSEQDFYYPPESAVL